jgi:putative membrane protein
MALADLPFPEINAALNATATVLLASGYVCIRKGNREAHRRLMIAALATSTVFLVSYLTSKGVAGRIETRYAGDGPAKWTYYVILATHVPLAASLLGLVPWAVMPALAARFDTHRRRARILFPIWIYVSVTGVLVYLFLRLSGSFDAAAIALPAGR